MKISKKLLFVYIFWFAVAVMCVMAPFTTPMFWLYKAAVWAMGGGNIIGFLLNWRMMLESIKIVDAKPEVEENDAKETNVPKTPKTNKKKKTVK